MKNVATPSLLLGAMLVLNSGCALFEQETSTSMPAGDQPSAMDQSMRADVDTALEQARQALQEAQNARQVAEEAFRAAREAQSGANACVARCENVEAQIERAFQQSQSK